MTAKIAVIIPYYQEEPGILRRAMKSVCAQEGVSNVEVIVVDDGAPVPAREELRGLPLPSHISLKILEQENAGPGAARNKGLDNVSEDTKYVAFLDSDDEWSREHLQRAHTALEKGYDFYFANYRGSEENIAIFAKHHVRLSDYGKISDIDNFYITTDSNPCSLIIQYNVVKTSTVFYRYIDLSELRFIEYLFTGEDMLFFLDVFVRTDKLVFSPVIECVIGKGINIHTNSGWDTEGNLIRTSHEVRWRKRMIKYILLNTQDKMHVRAELKELRHIFILGFLHDLRRGRNIDGKMLYDYLKEDPVIMLIFFPLAIKTLLSKLLGTGKR